MLASFLATVFLFSACLRNALVRFVFFITQSLLSWTMVVLDLCLPPFTLTQVTFLFNAVIES